MKYQEERAVAAVAWYGDNHRHLKRTLKSVGTMWERVLDVGKSEEHVVAFMNVESFLSSGQVGV